MLDAGLEAWHFFGMKSFCSSVGCSWILTLALAVPVQAVVVRDDRPASEYLDLGADAAYDSLGLLVSNWGYTGCGTLIAPDWVLTAAHNLTAASSVTFTVNGISYSSASFVKHPSWTGDALNGYDLALVQLSTPVVGVTPAELYQGADEWGQTACFVGLGFTGTGLTGWRPSDNLKRGFENVIDGDFGSPGHLLGADFDNPHNPAENWFGASLCLDLEGCVSPGDSGGGVFLTIGSEEYLAGIISFVAGTDGNGNGDYGDVTGFARVSTFAPWIAATIPEPSVATLLCWGALAGVVLRRRR